MADLELSRATRSSRSASGSLAKLRMCSSQAGSWPRPCAMGSLVELQRFVRAAPWLRCNCPRFVEQSAFLPKAQARSLSASFSSFRYSSIDASAGRCRFCASCRSITFRWKCGSAARVHRHRPAVVLQRLGAACPAPRSSRPAGDRFRVGLAPCGQREPASAR